MKHLFTHAGEQALASVLALQPLLAFDFDGTLAPIVARPDDARVSAAIAQQLKQLARLRPVAIVTGRTVADVMPRLGFEPHYIIGNHGAEDPYSGEPSTLAVGAGLDALRQRVVRMAYDLSSAGVTVEDKQFSMALHYRLARDRDLALACIQKLLEGLGDDLQTFGGKCVVNVVMANAPDKGDAVLGLVQRSGVQAAVFVGDDLNDEAVFERAAPHWLTVRIGRDYPRSRANYFLDGHAEVALFLRMMLSQLNTDLSRRTEDGSDSPLV